MADVNLASVSQTSNTPTSYTAAGMAIAAGSVFSSGVQPNPQQTAIAVGANLSVGGTLSLQRYVDLAGAIPQGDPMTLALSAGVAKSITIGDGAPFLSYSVTITPSGGAAAVLTAFAITLRASEAYGGGATVPFVADLILAELRVQTLAIYALINNNDNLKRIRQDQLTELGSSTASGLGS